MVRGGALPCVRPGVRAWAHVFVDFVGEGVGGRGVQEVYVFFLGEEKKREKREQTKTRRDEEMKRRRDEETAAPKKRINCALPKGERRRLIRAMRLNSLTTKNICAPGGRGL